MIDEIKELIESNGSKLDVKTETALIELDKALNSYMATFDIDFKPLLQELLKVLVQYNRNQKS